MNGPRVPAVGCMRTESTLDEKGRRRSTFDCFLPSRLVRARAAHLKLCPSTIVTSITCEHSEKGVRAVGVIIEEESSLIQRPPRRVRAKREVILCSGAIATPHLLLLRYVSHPRDVLMRDAERTTRSGIGPADELRKKNVKVQLHHPNVGKGLVCCFSFSRLFFERSLCTLARSPGGGPHLEDTQIGHLV
jgi:choline dehydrogenase